MSDKIKYHTDFQPRSELGKLAAKLTFGDIYHQKGKWFRVNGHRISELGTNFFSLVDDVYRPLYGGHSALASPQDVTASNFWTAINLHPKSGHANAVIFARKTNGGYKIRGIGHDGSKEAKSAVIAHLLYLLNKDGYWIEASDRLGEILLAKRTPIVTDVKTIEKLFPGQKIEIQKDGSYIRQNKYRETLFGKPKL